MGHPLALVDALPLRIIDNDHHPEGLGELDQNDVVVLRNASGQEERITVREYLSSDFKSDLSPGEKLKQVVKLAQHAGGNFANSARKFASSSKSYVENQNNAWSETEWRRFDERLTVGDTTTAEWILNDLAKHSIRASPSRIEALKSAKQERARRDEENTRARLDFKVEIRAANSAADRGDLDGAKLHREKARSAAITAGIVLSHPGIPGIDYFYDIVKLDETIGQLEVVRWHQEHPDIQ